MKSRTVHARAWAVAAAAALGAAPIAGCGHDHDARRSEPGPGVHANVIEAQAVAADRILEEARRYLAAREAGRGLPPAAPVEVVEDALLALFEAADALSLASRARMLIEELDVDRGRAARVNGTADVVRAAAERVYRDAEEVLRSRTGSAALGEDRKVLRAALRALKVDVLALERSA